MENFLNMLDSQLVLFVYLGIGIYMRKVGMIDDNTRLKWIDFIIKISLPCMVFSSFNEEFNVHTLKTTGIVFLLSLFVSALSLLLGNVLFRRYRAEKASILKYATLVNNSGFLGLPLIESVYGATGLLYASIHIIPNRIMMWTAGISVFTKADMKTKIKNILLNPAIIAIYLGILRRLFEILLPHFLEISISKVGGVTSPLSMIVIGSMLVEVEHKKLLEGAIIYFSVIRLVLLPISILFVYKAFGMEDLITGVAVILTGMPAGSTTALLASKYGADDEFASRLVVTSTILSLITAPVLMLFL